MMHDLTCSATCIGRLRSGTLYMELNVGFSALEKILATLEYSIVCEWWVRRMFIQKNDHRSVNQYELEGILCAGIIYHYLPFICSDR